jgi:protein-serine/threonine kinase
MSNRPSRPLPTPPGPVYPFGASDLNHIYSLSNPYQSPHPLPPYGLPGPSLPFHDGQPAATLRGGTLLHKGFYDLLALIPTPSPSRFLWGASADPAPSVLAGPRYEDLPGFNNAPGGKLILPAVTLPSSGPVSPKKGKRISKDMVSKPIGFVYVCDRCTSPSLNLKFGQPFSACI